MGINGISTGYYPTGYANNKTIKAEAYTDARSMATLSHSVSNATDYVSISEEGIRALWEKVSEYSPEPENITAYEITT